MTFNFTHPRWSPEQDATITRLWTEGISGSAIGREMGKTKNSVIARARRLKLNSRSNRKWTAQHDKELCRLKTLGLSWPSIAFKMKRTVASCKIYWLRNLIHRSLNTAPRKETLSLADLGPHDCRYPYGDPKEDGFGFCGERVQPGSSYCSVHHRLCLRRVEVAEIAA